MGFELTSTFGYAVNRCSILMRSELQARFARRGLNITAEEWALLGVIGQEACLTVSHLAKLTFKDRTTVTRLLDRLDKKRLVERQTSPEDQRAVLVTLTPRGSVLLRQLVSIAEELLGECAEALSPDELSITVAALQRVIGRLSSPS